MKNIFKTFLLIVVGVFLAGTSRAASLRGYAWSENVGWIKFNGSGYGVNVDDASGIFSGFAWSENIGWISFSGLGLSNFPSGPFSAPKIDNKTGLVSGWARACVAAPLGQCSGDATNTGGFDGWIKMSGANYGVKKNILTPNSCDFSGYAWGGAVLGWINFKGVNYGVTSSDCVSDLAECDFSASRTLLIKPQNSLELTWSCRNATKCNISDLGVVDPKGGTVGTTIGRTTTFTLSCLNKKNIPFSSSIEVKVLRPVYCEVTPTGPGCN